MAGAVLENLSTRKLIALCVVLLLFQAAFFMLGGIIAPSPTTAYPHLTNKCVDTGKHRHKQQWFIPWGEFACEKIVDLEDAIEQEIVANQIVFSIEIPNRPNKMSRWFQYILTVMDITIAYHNENPLGPDPVITMEISLGYRNEGDAPGDWKELIKTTEERKLECTFDRPLIPESNDYTYHCDPMPFMELGSCHHDYYLINIRVPVHEHKDINLDLGKLQDIHIIEIHQNGGFTKVWFALKTFVTPLIIMMTIWFWRRVCALNRQSVLMERTILALGISLIILDLPIEWLTLSVDIPFMLLISDIRQGIFYSMLLSFWIIFAGEHLMDQTERNRLSVYWTQVTAIVFGCTCLFVFDMCERGVQLSNPFYSIWITDTGKNLAMAFIIVAGICASLYFMFLCYMVYRVFRNISVKKTALPAMAKARQLHYQGLIYRFKFFMFFTLLCAAMTVIFFIITQVNEGRWKWGEEHTVEVNSAFFTGVYGMWNIYVFAVLSLYAPSHKDPRKYESTVQNGDVSGSSNEEYELRRTLTDSAATEEPSELYRMTGKTAQD
ncbi:protein wntless homolog [Saccoglossus kowalevskii]|uniref:Protein wntless homolog n=1 Tax=Saccoglossus kowalevskii TaxID=10224 RepID=A0ABM0GRI9_SACKO|nr:PREDICTED: protein wntless homolog [Saccoglossus kowalevskii]